MARPDRDPLDPRQGARSDGSVGFAAVPLAGSERRRRPIAIAIVLVALVTLAIAKPWGGMPSARTVVLPSGAAAAIVMPGSSTPAAATEPPSGGLPDLMAGGPIVVPPPGVQTMAAIEGLIARRAGAWGIADGGSGPRLVRDDPWADWEPATPFAAEAWPGSLLQWPGTALCAGASDLLDRPAVVAMTTPSGVAAVWAGSGWWSDGATIRNLAGLLTAPGVPRGGATIYLVRRDGQRWPDGRYEIHLRAGQRTLALTFCLGRG